MRPQPTTKALSNGSHERDFFKLVLLTRMNVMRQKYRCGPAIGTSFRWSSTTTLARSTAQCLTRLKNHCHGRSSVCRAIGPRVDVFTKNGWLYALETEEGEQNFTPPKGKLSKPPSEVSNMPTVKNQLVPLPGTLNRNNLFSKLY